MLLYLETKAEPGALKIFMRWTKLKKNGDCVSDVYSVSANFRCLLYSVFYTTSVNLFTDKMTKQEYKFICTCNLILPLKVTRRVFL